jgi:polysaccharide export outer membrane protein
MRRLSLSLLLLGACHPAVSESYLAWAEKSWQFQDPGRLGVGDSFSIKVFGQADLSGELVVNENGVIRFPLLGIVTAQGRTCAELEEDLTQRLAAEFIKVPLVTCSLVEMRSRRISVVGQVVSPGSLPYTPGLTVVDAVAAAKGIDAANASGDVVLTRVVDGKQVRVEVPLQEIMRGRAPNLLLWPGDVVFVPSFQLLN